MNKPHSHSIIKCLYASAIILTLPSLTINAQTPRNTAAESRIQLIPELTYRQSYFDQRKSSPYYLDRYRNYMDQIFLSLKMVKTFQFVNEIVLEPTVRTVRDRPGAIETVIDQGYLVAAIEGVTLTAGKKAEYEGTGFFINPSDLLNERKDLFDNLYQQEGKYFTRLTRQWSNSSLSLGFIPKQDIHDSGNNNSQGKGSNAEEGLAWLKARSRFGETDLHVQYTYNKLQRSTVGFSASSFIGDRFELHTDARYQQRQRTNLPERVIFNCPEIERTVDANPELSCLTPQLADDDGSFYAVLGSRLVFTPKRTLILEGIQNQSGLHNEEREMYLKYLDTQKLLNNAEAKLPVHLSGRQYWFLAYQDEDTLRKTMFNFALLLNNGDRSIFSNTELRYALSNMHRISLVYNRLDGKYDSEFGAFPFRSSVNISFSGRF